MANNAKQVMDIRVSKGITVAQSNEHLRNWTEKGWNHATQTGNYDPTREHLNFEIVKGGLVAPINKAKSIPERMAENLRERGFKDPNDGLLEPKYRTVVNCIFGGSRERMHELAYGTQKVNFEHGADNSHIQRCEDIEKWAKDVYSFVCEKYGEENIAAFIVHCDELNPHIHCTLLPIKDGRFAFKKLFAEKDKYEYSAKMKQLHSDFAEVNAKWGMSRGTSVAETGARHRSTEEYRRHLSEQCTTIEQQIVQHKKALSDLNKEIDIARRRVKGLSSMVENLLREKAEKEAQLANLQQQILEGKANPEALKEAVAKLEDELTIVQNKLADKQEKLLIAHQQLEELKSDMTDIQQRTDDLKSEAQEYARDVHSKVDSLLKDALLENLVNEQQHRLAMLNEVDLKMFDGSLLQDLAERGTEIMHCATLLFLGMVDNATTFAEGNGGGGSGNDMKWGRDDDEDNRAWARRCMMMACKMMRPSIGKKPKR